MSNRDIFLWLIGSLIAVGVMIWTAIYLMDHYLFAESPAAPTTAGLSCVRLAALLQGSRAMRGSCIGQPLRCLRKSADIL
jgi:hypothetical protein